MCEQTVITHPAAILHDCVEKNEHFRRDVMVFPHSNCNRQAGLLMHSIPDGAKCQSNFCPVHISMEIKRQLAPHEVVVQQARSARDSHNGARGAGRERFERPQHQATSNQPARPRVRPSARSHPEPSTCHRRSMLHRISQTSLCVQIQEIKAKFLMQYEAGLDGWVSSEKSGIMKMAGGRERLTAANKGPGRTKRTKKEQAAEGAHSGASERLWRKPRRVNKQGQPTIWIVVQRPPLVFSMPSSTSSVRRNVS